jgi:tetratricopeptide (TPR) repeat protein
MKSTPTKSSGPRAAAVAHPPPLTRGSETLEGMDILREIGGEAGILLWQSYRNVMFWATAEPADRGKLFSPDAGREAPGRAPGRRHPHRPGGFAGGRGPHAGAPDTTTGDALAEACRAIAQWADHHGYESTSLSFTQAAAVSSPRNAAIAYEVGKLARRRGDIARAETWFRHAIMIARQTGDWDSYVQAYLGLGTLSMLRGNYPQAHRMHIKGLRAARRKGLIKLQGAALHDLFVIATETNRPTTALDYARGAFKAYGPEHPNLPKLAHDVAYFWMNEGYFERALPVFQALVPYFALPEALILHAHIARAAGGTGDRELFRREWNEAIRLSRFTEAEKLLADSLLELGLGSAALSEWDRAEQVLERAIEVAERRGETMIRLRAEGILESARSGRRADQQLAAKRPVSKDETAADVLAERLIESLTTSAVPAHA